MLRMEVAEEATVKYLAANISPGSVLDLLQFADQMSTTGAQAAALRRNIIDWLLANFAACAAQLKTQPSYALLSELIASDSLAAKEEEVLECVLEWAKHDAWVALETSHWRRCCLLSDTGGWSAVRKRCNESSSYCTGSQRS